MVELVLDTNAASAFFDGSKNVVDRIDLTPSLYLPATVIGEFAYGAMKSKGAEANLRKLSVLEKGCTVISCDATVARMYGKIKIDLERSERLIPENDMWIAACALHVGIPLLTNDKHFDLVEGVVRVSW